MKLHGPEYQGDPKQVILAGNSSGGHTAVYASFFPEGEDNLYPYVNAKVSGVVDFYGSVSVMHEDSKPTTINHLQADSPEGMEMGHVDLMTCAEEFTSPSVLKELDAFIKHVLA